MDVVVAGHFEQWLWMAGHLEQFIWLVVRPRVSRIGVPGDFCWHFASMRMPSDRNGGDMALSIDWPDFFVQIARSGESSWRGHFCPSFVPRTFDVVARSFQP